MYPDDVFFTKEHEWIREEDGEFFVGITSHAAESLGDVTYVELPEVGAEVTQGAAVATVESIKAASDVYAPASGRVAAVNAALEGAPELVNQDPYGDGWFFSLESVDGSELGALMDAVAYAAFVEELDQ